MVDEESPMNWQKVVILVLFPLLAACSAREDFIVLSPAADGSVGALAFSNDAGSTVLAEPGMALYPPSLDTQPTAPSPIDAIQSEAVFAEALRVHPLMPESFLLYFQHNSDQLTEESAARITDVKNAIKIRNSVDVLVIGHTDRTGEEEYNRRLSLERARRVADILASAGVNAADIVLDYHGEGNPLVATADNIAEPRNRRVEVQVR